MQLWISLLAGVSGYLAGAIPFAVLVVRIFGRGQKFQETVLPIQGTNHVLHSDAVSATSVRLQLGARYGCLTSLLDMAKAAAVTLAFRLAFPNDSYFLIASGFAVVGHIWPIFHRFRGGRGQSPVIGGLFVVDWPAPLIAYPLAQVLGLVTRSRAYAGRFAPMLIASGWLYLRFHDLSFVYYGLGLFIVRTLAMRDEIKQYRRIRQSGALQTLSDEAALMGYDALLSRLVERARRVLRWNRAR